MHVWVRLGLAAKRRIALFVLALIVTVSAAEFVATWWLLRENTHSDLRQPASQIAAMLKLPLRDYNNASIDASRYFIVGSDGTVYDVGSDSTGGILDGVLPETKFLGDETPLFVAPRKESFPWLSGELEEWTLFAKKLHGGRVILGISSLDPVARPTDVLKETAAAFGESIAEAKKYRYGNNVHFAILSDDNRYVSGFGRIPLRTNALALGNQGLGFGRGTAHTALLREPFSRGDGGVGGTIIVGLDTSDIDDALFQLGRLKVIVAALLFVIVVLLMVGVWNTKEAERQHIHEQLAAHFSPSVAEVVTRLRLDPAGERREVAILFSDIKGFTRLSAKLAPTTLTALLNQYFGEMTDAVHATGGAVDKFIGDAVMAYWGAPMQQSDMADRAVSAAIRMIERLKTLNATWAAHGVSPMSIRIGINVGVVTIGYLGAASRHDYTIIGDAVNVASRLEALNKRLRTEILVSEQARRHLSPRFLSDHSLIDTGLHQLDGVEHPVRVYEVRLDAAKSPTPKAESESDETSPS